MSFMKQGLYTKAMNSFNNAEKYDKNNRFIYINKGKAYMKLK